MNSYMNLLFLIILAFSTFTALSAESWFQIWLSLEINMMAFIPLMLMNSSSSVKSMMKYFIIQSMASSIFLSSTLLNMAGMNLLFSMEMTSLALLTKLGMFPIFFWFPEVSEGLSWQSFILLSTWQKLIPLFILSSSMSNILWMSIFGSAWTGCVSMFNLISIRKILAFSSINNMAWMSLSFYANNLNWGLFFTIYSFMMISIFFLLKTNNIGSIYQMSTNYYTNLWMLITLLSLGGLPPLLGFIPKWLIIANLNLSMVFMTLNLIMTSLLSIYIYLRLLYPSIFLKQMKIKKYLFSSNFMFAFFNTMMLVPMIPLMLI